VVVVCQFIRKTTFESDNGQTDFRGSARRRLSAPFQRA
jgi:hypothetical protein